MNNLCKGESVKGSPLFNAKEVDNYWKSCNRMRKKEPSKQNQEIRKRKEKNLWQQMLNQCFQ